MPYPDSQVPTPDGAAVDTSGTNPAVLTRSLNLTNEYVRLTNGKYSNTTNFRFTEPFARGKMSFRLTMPLVATDILGKDEFGLGDIKLKWSWVANANPKTGLILSTELAAPTASESILGTGKWTFSPSITYAFFVNKNIIIAPAYIHNFSFAGDSSREDIHRGDFDLYIVYTSSSKQWWITSDVTLSFDYRTGTIPASWKVQYGRNLAKLPGGGALNGVIRPGIGIGGERLYDWSLEVGLSLVGF